MKAPDCPALLQAVNDAALLYAQQVQVVNSLQEQLALQQGILGVRWAAYQQAAIIYADSCPQGG